MQSTKPGLPLTSRAIEQPAHRAKAKVRDMAAWVLIVVCTWVVYWVALWIASDYWEE